MIAASARPAAGWRPSINAGRLRAIRHGLSIAGLMAAGYMLFVVAPTVGTFGFDAYAYWSVNPANPYPTDLAVGNLGFFPYSPPMAAVSSLFALVPWWVFLWLWTSLLVATLVWLGGRWSLAWLAFPPVLVELYHGNIHLLLAAAIVLGFRYSWTWVFVLLTKVTPGIGLVWFAVRREWRPLFIALGLTSAIVLVSLILEPQLWRDWFSVLGQGAPQECDAHCLPVPLIVRLPIALVIVVLGALANQRWTVPVASMVALPVLWVTGPAMLVGAATLAAIDHRKAQAAAAAVITTGAEASGQLTS